MRIKIESPCPLSTTQKSLAQIRKYLRDQHNDSQVEISSREHLPEITRCTARVQIGGRSSNWCSGSVIAAGNIVEREANAELAAIAMCCMELGIEIEYSGQATDDILTASPMARFDRNAVLACRDISQVYFRMKQYGLDANPIKQYGKDLKKSGKRLTKHAIADFLFPLGTEGVYVRENKEPAKIEKHKPKAEAQDQLPDKVPIKDPLRSGAEAQKIMSELTSRGIGYDAVCKIHGKTFGSMLNFALFATLSQINQVSPNT